LSLSFTEAQRVAAIKISGTPGGDQHPALLTTVGGAFKDNAGNDNTAQDFVFTEIADTILPVAQSGTINYGTGTVTFSVSETVDLNPISNIDITKFFLENVANDETVDLTGSIATNSADALIFTLTLTETQRVTALQGSATSGGDGYAILGRVKANGFQDVAINGNGDTSDIPMTETADSIVPTLLSASVNLTDGTVLITCSETVNLALVDLVKIALANNDADPTAYVPNSDLQMEGPVSSPFAYDGSTTIQYSTLEVAHFVTDSGHL
jgi:hypothetical protein